ncbi:hypothetical protein LTR64_006303 [Lithohypha guttulata]|uniref:Uncharacterized protein n=1 Tax=Lithohypha guttulata TaxID=1690604 RepID=A0AAN7T4P0_9EURO|nr:hypothetical protein LTR05_000541 [Lithohypha guttulata]
MTRPTATRNISSDSATVPGLTHQDSLESVRSPITPSMETSKNPIASPAHKSSFDEPLSAPPTITVFKTEHANTSEPVLPPKNLPFLQHDPYADDDVIQFDKNKEIKPSRSGSVRSIMSTIAEEGSFLVEEEVDYAWVEEGQTQARQESDCT